MGILTVVIVFGVPFGLYMMLWVMLDHIGLL